MGNSSYCDWIYPWCCFTNRDVYICYRSGYCLGEGGYSGRSYGGFSGGGGGGGGGCGGGGGEMEVVDIMFIFYILRGRRIPIT